MTPDHRRRGGSHAPNDYGPVATADIRPSSDRDGTREHCGPPGPNHCRDDDDASGTRHGSVGGRSRVGAYRLIRRLGQGSQGEVWKAVRLVPPAEVVALKVLSPLDRHSPQKLARFRREAVRGAAMDARGILPVYEFGQDDHVAFFAMPLVEGVSLSRVLNHRRRHRAGATPSVCYPLALVPEPLYIDSVARILASVARALADAHSVRVVHCDVKPANILVERADGGRAYLIDFGLGRDLDAVSATRTTVDGTMLYMAPEKLSGRRVDESLCDIYALGATGYEALALRLPRDLPEGLARPLWARYLAGAEPPHLGTIVPRLPEDLGAIVARAMERDPARRYQSAIALVEDLERYLRGVTSR